LIDELAHLKSDNVELKKKISDLQGLVAGPPGTHIFVKRKQKVGVQSLPSLPKLHRKVLVS
jgi:hypothetical protein